MAEEAGVLKDATIGRAVSNIQSRSERQPELAMLERTYVDTGVLPQLQNDNNQILYGRRGTGKSHVFRILGAAHDREVGGRSHIYVDMRLIGSAQLMTDRSLPLTVRCVSVFRDLLSEIQNHLWDVSTDPDHASQGAALEAVEAFTQSLSTAAKEVGSRELTVERSEGRSSEARLEGRIGTGGVSIGGGLGDGASNLERVQEIHNELDRQTVVFSEVAGTLNNALEVLDIDRLLVLIDEWTAIPGDLQPFLADFIKRCLMTRSRLTVKVASLEHRSQFSLRNGENNVIGFELGPDIAANLDLDDYYVYERNPDQVVESFLELLYQHLSAELPDDYLAEQFDVRTLPSFRTRFFTEPATFVELVRAGEGVVRDFLGIFTSAYFRARRQGNQKIDMSSIEEAARDWFETDKSVNLSSGQHTVLNRIITDVIGSRQARSFLLERTQASHPMIQSLFDLRLVHLMRRGYSDKENPGLRYNIYTLDYGTYVDLKRTNRQPEIELVEVDAASAERVVPFDDKRSIRRIVLDPVILEVGEGEG